MRNRYVIGLDGRGIDAAIKGVEAYRQWLTDGARALCQKLTERGLSVAQAGFDAAVYDGARGEFQLTVDERGELKRAVVALGETVLFIEFGTGVTYPDDHPEAAAHGMVRGGYGKGYGKRKTWGFYGEDTGTNGELAVNKNGDVKVPHVVLTHGNPANKPMYAAARMLEQEFAQLVKEAFAT